MRVACVNLPSPFLIDDKVFPPLGILYVASALRKVGYEPIWYDFSGATTYKSVDENIVFITATSPQIPTAIKYVEEFCKGKKTVIGGCGVTSLTHEQESIFDTVVSGEAEECIKTVLSSCHNVNGEKTNLDKVEFPARDLIQGYEYKINRRSATTILTSRGCPHNCIFCVDGGHKGFRLASVDRVCEEIDEVSNLGYRALMFFDDIFTLKKKRLREISNHLLSMGFLYRCFTHVNSVNIELCKILADSGCVEVGIGIESGSDTILKTIKKGFTKQKSIEAVNLLSDFGIRVKAFLMLGLPGESYNTIDETKKWLQSVRVADFDISLFSPYPDTEVWSKKADFDISWNGDTPKFYKGKVGEYNPFVSTSGITKDELVKERDSIERRFKNAVST